MSRLTDLGKMQKLVDIKYRQQQESFARLMAQETRLRTSLQQLDAYLADSIAQDDTPQRAIGADVVWQSWIGRKKRDLNMQLAQVLAVKEGHIAQVRTAYGKVLVTDTLIEQTRAQEKQQKARTKLDHAIVSLFP
ncbi:MAG: hypothetical protein WBG95_16895 [Sulfitobacter sp.]